jgi:hypothetical protein
MILIMHQHLMSAACLTLYICILMHRLSKTLEKISGSVFTQANNIG